MKITSTLARSWPAYGIAIPVGTSEIDTSSPEKRELVLRLIAPYLEVRQMWAAEAEPAPKGAV